MTVFSDVPSPFPLNVSLKTRPATYRLEVDSAERIATLVLCAFWGLGVPFVLYLAADPFSPWPDDVPLGRSAALAGLMAFILIGVPFWLWPNIQSVMRQVDVRITDTDIDVVEGGLLGKRRWSKPIGEYLGVAIENWGSRSVGSDKLPIAAVVLVHSDDRFSVPLHMDGAMRVKDRIAKGKAELLGLPLIEAPKFGRGATAHASGTIVANRAQALKVRVLYSVFGLVGMAGAIAAPIGYAKTGEALYLVLGLLGVVLAGAIHFYASCYVTAMRRVENSIEVDTAVPFFGKHKLKPDAVCDVGYREGRGGAGTALATHTPWVKIVVAGRRLPYIVDMQSDFVDEQALIDLGRPKKGPDV